jgi:hypothetical protein
MAEGKVRVYDLRSGRLTRIPARELAPGMLRAHVEGVAGDVWVDALQVRPGPVRHPPFGEDMRQVVRYICHAVQDVVSLTVEEWEDGFRRDRNPAVEVAFWRAVAEAYTHVTAGRPLSPEHKGDLLDVIFACLHNGPEYVLLTTNPSTVSSHQVREIAAYVGRNARGT